MNRVIEIWINKGLATALGRYVDLVVNQALTQIMYSPYYSVVSFQNPPLDKSELVLIQIEAPKEIADAWENTPDELKDKLLSAVDIILKSQMS